MSAYQLFWQRMTQDCPKRTHYRIAAAINNMSVDLGSPDILMTELFLNSTDVHAAF